MDSFSKARALFSKALPPPPPSDNSSSSSKTSKIGKDDTISNASASGATSSSSTRVFPPRTTSTKPPPPFSPPPPPSKLDSPLPRLQEQVAPSSLLQADSIRSPIQRRPVAPPTSPRPVAKAPTPTEPSSLLSPTLTAPSPNALLAPPSPALSFYSLISAYSRDSEEPAVTQASQATEGSKNSSHVSPSALGSDGKPQQSPYTLPPLDFKDSPSSGTMFGDDKPPPPPIKDGAVPARKPLPLSSNTGSDQPAGNAIQAPLPPPPDNDDKKTQPPAEIWKRRSDKTDKPIGVSELKLTATNGSTSAPKINTQPVQSISTAKSPHNPEYLQQPGTNLSAPDAKLKSPQPPRSGGLPGRNIRPNAPAETSTQNGSRVPTVASDTLSKIGTNGSAKLVDGTPAEDKKENVTVQSQQDDAVRHLPDYHSQKQSQQKAQSQPPIQSPDAGIRRLPTPDYEQHDVKSPIVEHVVSPVSPASSPDLISSYLDEKKPLPVAPSSASSSDQGPAVPKKALKPPASSAATLPASPAPKMGNLCSLPKSPRPRADAKEPSVSSTRGSHTKAHGSVEVPSVVEKTAGSSTRSLQEPAPNPTPVATDKSLQVQIPPNPQGQARARSSSPSVESSYSANVTSPRDQFPARTTSKTQGLPSSPLARINNQDQQIAQAASITEAFLESDASASQVSTVRPTTSQQQHQPNHLSPYETRPPPTGSDGTIYKELVQSDDFDPAIARFPATKLTSDDVLSGSVYKMRSLSRSQLNCFHRHRFMVPTSNANYSLACQTCTRADSEDRFRCKFCYLRICASCRDVLAQNRGDLDALMAHVKTHGSSTAHAPSGSTNSNIAGVPGFPVVTAPA
ncbi:hypothetical protein MCOR27_009007 [Pyricularia oryzae]|uniref:Uncharacterized protein n=2 Tax=Pyricularia TaxID=48558 RepID=A0ABQ8ND86_PYRGI|nr:hypothetical protein MCOR01_010928 [Pyricularia oryzae]KAI6295198.1 hypothetical protein MCOR33_007868 [Pyricularia grisea]KAH9438034.1 hypothetical protein MCOR02_001675 [Pyricularia oryzae]KAI6257726.1 hypothetical protein MCOR19_005881 [Pyricularia oryzae]KAI6271051.1 hypothetical protein MCOR27_009007 [Pyricularia oryzae]